MTSTHPRRSTRALLLRPARDGQGACVNAGSADAPSAPIARVVSSAGRSSASLRAPTRTARSTWRARECNASARAGTECSACPGAPSPARLDEPPREEPPRRPRHGPAVLLTRRALDLRRNGDLTRLRHEADRRCGREANQQPEHERRHLRRPPRPRALHVAAPSAASRRGPRASAGSRRATRRSAHVPGPCARRRGSRSCPTSR